MPSGAPATAQYLLLAAESILTNARLFTVSGLLVATDSGPTSTYDVALDQASLILANLTDLDSELQSEYIAKALLTTNGDLIYRAAGAPTTLPVGAIGQVLEVSGSSLPTWADLPTIPPAYQWPPTSGDIISAAIVNSAYGTQSCITGFIRLTPVFIATTTTIDRIQCEVTTGNTGNVRMLIYGPLTSGFASIPLILDTGNIAVSGTGVKTSATNQTLTPGWYLLGQENSTTHTYRSFSAGQTVQSFPSAAMGATRPRNYFFVAHTYGTAPNPITGLAYSGDADLCPVIEIRVT